MPLIPPVDDCYTHYDCDKTEASGLFCMAAILYLMRIFVFMSLLCKLQRNSSKSTNFQNGARIIINGVIANWNINKEYINSIWFYYFVYGHSVIIMNKYHFSSQFCSDI